MASFFAKKFYVMKKQITMSVSAAIEAWLSAESMLFSYLCGERITHLDVIKTFVFLVILLKVIGMAGGME